MSPAAQKNAPAAPAEKRTGSPLARLLAAAGGSKRAIAITGAALLITTGTGAVLALVVLSSRHGPKPPTLTEALDALDQGFYQSARDIAEECQAQHRVPPEQLGWPAFILGAVASHEADEIWEQDKPALYLLAARRLEEARDRAFPPGREGEGLYLLGRSLCLAGQMSAARPQLQAALKAAPELSTEIDRLMATAWLQDANPNYQEALRYNERYLADPQLLDEVREEGLLQRSQILFQLGDLDASREVLAKVPAESRLQSEVLILRAQMLMREAAAAKKTASPPSDKLDEQAAQHYQEALKLLREAQGRDTLDNRVSRRSMYLIGVCFHELHDDRAALDQWQRTSALYPDTAEAFAAGLQEAELLGAADHDDDALACFRRTLATAGPQETYSNPWFSLDDVRQRVLTAYRRYIEAGKYSTALELAIYAESVLPRYRSSELVAETHRAWGQTLLRQAQKASHPEADQLLHDGRRHLRRAGAAYERLAEARIITRNYPDDLWFSAESYLRGQEYQRAALLFDKYLRVEARARRPRALLGLAEALLALGRLKEAQARLDECIEYYPRDAATYDARLMAAHVYQEEGRHLDAEAQLLGILQGDDLTPQSKEWREALFALGKLLFATERFPDAIARLTEAVERYPEDPLTLESRYLIASAYRRLTDALSAKLAGEVSDRARTARHDEIQRLLQQALTQYDLVLEGLAQRQQSISLTAEEQVLFRNSLFARGTALVEMARYPEAIKNFSTATNRYLQSPEVLEAYVQIANCYRRMNKPLDALGTIEQAKVILNRLAEDAPFAETTNRTRQEWAQYLDWLKDT
jgi:tetratricopeptide (TPR) repeat protein